MSWRVTAMVQAEGNEPVEMSWVRDGSEISAISAVAGLFEQNSVPNSHFPELLSIFIEKV